MLDEIKTKLTEIIHSFSYFIVWSLHALILLPFVQVKVEGRENIPRKGKVILAGNHQNFSDGFFLSYALGPFRRLNFPISKRVLKLKIWQILTQLMGSVIVDGEVEYQRALKKLHKVLSCGGSVGIFPEGDVSSREVPRKFKGGVAKLSLDSKAPVIPVYLSGTFNLRYLKYWFNKPQILIKIGKPVELYNYSEKFENNLDKLASFLREKIIETMELNSQTPASLISVYKTNTNKSIGKVS